MPAIVELAELAYKEFGGPRKLIKAIVEEWHKTEGIARQRIGASIMSLLRAAAQQQADSRQADEWLSEEDLKHEFYELTNDLLSGAPKLLAALAGLVAALDDAELSSDKRILLEVEVARAALAAAQKQVQDGEEKEHAAVDAGEAKEHQPDDGEADRERSGGPDAAGPNPSP